jgi:hypothetical protein
MPSLIGNKPNQVPSNGDLGTMAFREQDQFYSTQQSLGLKNRIINGAMVIDQRNASASVTVPNDSNFYTTDRWQIVEDTDCVLSAQQVTDAPTGFQNSLRVTVTTAATSIGTSAVGIVEQRIEGFNTADLAFGTSSASTITFSFWVKSSLTGNFSGSLRNSAGNRSYPFSYAINAANTWEQKSVTIPGETTGTWVTNNGIGMRVTFAIGSGSNRLGTANAWAASSLDGVTGSTALVSTLNATWQITGVQLEKGSTATSVDYRPYGTELALCHRYSYVTEGSVGNGGVAISSTEPHIHITYPVIMRATPTVSLSTSGSFRISDDYSSDINATTISINGSLSNPTKTRLRLGGFSGLTTARFYSPDGLPTSTAKILFSAEL